jgi:endonuclease YncB( thermonuclease family)
MRRAILAALASLLLVAQAPADGPWRTVSVVDGDTVTLESAAGFVTGIKIRLLGIDAPEMRGGCEAERQLAQQATDRLRQLVGARVRIVSQLEMDPYGRLLARLYDRAGRDVGQVLVAEGLARPLNRREARQPWCPAP